MADTIENEQQQFNIQAIAQHLKKGLFAPIFEQSAEKTDPVALKMMCVVDYNVQCWNLYHRMQAVGPKLMRQLMQFRSYGTFKYYDYLVGSDIEKFVLKCKFCDLIGPYGYILTHMAINHDTHIGLKLCVYCKRIDLKQHFVNNSLDDCYAEYIRNNDIEMDEDVCDIVTAFYDTLKGLAAKFKIKTLRNYGFTGKGRQVSERLPRSYGSDIDRNIKVIRVLTPSIKAKNISGHVDALNHEFKRVMSFLYGGNNDSRMMQQATGANSNGCDQNDTIVISDDSDDEVDDSNVNEGGIRFASRKQPVKSEDVADNQTQGFQVSSMCPFENE